MDRKNQHYVPKFHLRQWSTDGKLISLYNKYNQKFVDNKGAIKNMASKDYLYDKDGEVEALLGEIEASISPIYHKIINAVSLSGLTEDELEWVYLHFMLCNERTCAAGEDREKLEKASLQAALKICQAHGKFMDLDAETIQEHIHLEFPCNQSIEAALNYYPLMMDLNISLIQNVSNVEFITSDYPCIKYNWWSVSRNLYSGWGTSSVGIMYILPICPRLALIAYDPVIYSIRNLKNNIAKIKNDSDINEINRLMLLNANQNVFFSKNIPLHYVNKKLIPSIKEYNKPPCVVQSLGNTESILVIGGARKIHYRANFKFLSIFPESLEWAVPSHAAGLLRPTSKEIAKSIGISIGANRNNSQ